MRNHAVVKNESVGAEEWRSRWIDFLIGAGYDVRRGRSQERRVRLRSLEVEFGRILAVVEERVRSGQAPAQKAASRPGRGPNEGRQFTVQIQVAPLRDDEWTRVLDALAGEALFAAQMLAEGSQWETMPAAFDAVFAGEEVSLLPAAQAGGEIVCSCSGCSAGGADPYGERGTGAPSPAAARRPGPCRHALAVCHLFGQKVADDPWLLLRLRGRDRQQVLAALRRRRSDAGSGGFGPTRNDLSPDPGLRPSVFHSGPARPAAPDGGGESAAAEIAPALTAEVESFWGRRSMGPEGASQDLRDLHYNFSPPLIRLALLRRLGPPPFSRESLEIYDRLGSIYQEVSERAIELAFAPEPEGEDAA